MTSKKPKNRLPDLLQQEPTVQQLMDRMKDEAQEAFIDAAFDLWILFEARQDVLLRIPDARVDNGELIRAFMEFREAGHYLSELER